VQTLPQVPQLFRSIAVFAQRNPQRERFAAHAIAQLPAVQLSRKPQAIAQPPQFNELVIVSTHAPPHNVVEPTQFSPHVPPEQTLGLGHGTLQPPQ
jgi:hypothetical protein